MDLAWFYNTPLVVENEIWRVTWLEIEHCVVASSARLYLGCDIGMELDNDRLIIVCEIELQLEIL